MLFALATNVMIDWGYALLPSPPFTSHLPSPSFYFI